MESVPTLRLKRNQYCLYALPRIELNQAAFCLEKKKSHSLNNLRAKYFFGKCGAFSGIQCSCVICIPMIERDVRAVSCVARERGERRSAGVF